MVKVEAGTFNNEKTGRRRKPRVVNDAPPQALTMIATRYTDDKCVTCTGPRDPDGYPICKDCGQRNTGPRPRR